MLFVTTCGHRGHWCGALLGHSGKIDGKAASYSGIAFCRPSSTRLGQRGPDLIRRPRPEPRLGNTRSETGSPQQSDWLDRAHAQELGACRPHRRPVPALRRDCYRPPAAGVGLIETTFGPRHLSATPSLRPTDVGRGGVISSAWTWGFDMTTSTTPIPSALIGLTAQHGAAQPVEVTPTAATFTCGPATANPARPVARAKRATAAPIAVARRWCVLPLPGRSRLTPG